MRIVVVKETTLNMVIFEALLCGCSLMRLEKVETRENKEVCAHSDHHGVGLRMVSTKADYREHGHKGGDNEGWSYWRLQ